MISRIIEIGNPARLSFKDRQLRVERDDQPAATVPLEDLGVLVIDHPQVSVTLPVLSACAEANVAVVVCDSKHLPAALLSPFEANTLHTRTLREQIRASEPTKKRLWQAIVQAKIREQSALLKELFTGDGGVGELTRLVRSGDPENVEARAAQSYWTRLFGSDFLRDRDLSGANTLLNYGYAVVRAAVARAVVGAGLHPALGIHHRNQYNPFALADDLVEPLRPLVDAAVFHHVRTEGEAEELTPSIKRVLLGVLTEDVQLDGRRYPLMTALGLYAANMRRCLLGEHRKLSCPGR